MKIGYPISVRQRFFIAHVYRNIDRMLLNESLKSGIVENIKVFHAVSAYWKWRIEIGGSFQKFCTLYVFSLKMNLFYRIHLQAFNVISAVIKRNGDYIEDL
jgi:hypothetical protein